MKNFAKPIVLAALLSTIGVSTAFAAVSPAITSSATFISSCTFGTITPGTLVLANSNKSVTTDTAVQSGGTAATVAITYFGTPSLSFSTATVAGAGGIAAGTVSSYGMAAVSANPSNVTAWTFNTANGASNGGGVYSGGSADTITLKQTVNWAAQIPAGAYSVSQTATCG